jgi:hypothetical protein
MPPSTRIGYDLACCCARNWPEVGILVASGATPPGRDDLPMGALFLDKPFITDTVNGCLNQLFPDR